MRKDASGKLGIFQLWRAMVENKQKKAKVPLEGSIRVPGQLDHDINTEATRLRVFKYELVQQMWSAYKSATANPTATIPQRLQAVTVENLTSTVNFVPVSRRALALASQKSLALRATRKTLEQELQRLQKSFRELQALEEVAAEDRRDMLERLEREPIVDNEE